MKIVGIMPARNEDWCLGLTARAALMWLDALVILEHTCTDNTPDICFDIAAEHEGRVVVLIERNPVWEEMRHRQRMLDAARQLDATHICYIDADEILSGDLLPHIRPIFGALQPSILLQIPWLALRGSLGKVHGSGPWADRQQASFGFMDDPALHWSSASRGGYDFHQRQPMGKNLMPWTPLGATSRHSGLMHLQFVSGRRLRAKQAWYKVQEVLRWPGREPDQIRAVDERYNLAVYGQARTPTADEMSNLEKTLATAPVDLWWKPYSHLLHHFRPQTKPWQEAEILKAIAEYGPKRFAGLDLFGIGDPAFREREP
jgi:Glycosyl transferase family 2